MKMENIKFIEAVTERDVDLLLLEELTVSSEFQRYFVGKVGSGELGGHEIN